MVVMTVKDTLLPSADKSYKPSQRPDRLVIARRKVNVEYRKSYGGISLYFEGIMKDEKAVLRFTYCANKEEHDEPRILRFLVPRADCPECYHRTEWDILPDATRFYVETKSTAVSVAGISFMDRLPVTVAWLKAVLPDGVELDTLVAGMVGAKDYDSLAKGDELKPLFRKEPEATASDVMWVQKGTPPEDWPEEYLASKFYEV